MSRFLPLVYQASQIAMIHPLTFHHPSKPLFGYVTACSAPLIALLVAGAVAGCFMLEHGWHGYLGLSQYLLYLINAHIYLVKGGRLGLMPGVLFHSCRPSFLDTSVMFLDFASLTRWGVWGPLDSSLWIKLFQQGPTLVLTFAINN